MFPNLREVNDLNEVQSALSVCKDEVLSFIVWKNSSNDRLTLKATLNNFFITKNTLAILDVENTSNLSLDETIYIYQEKLNFLFKGIVVKKDKKSFSLQLESKLFLKEKRDIKRFVFDRILFDGFFEVLNELVDKNKKFKAEIHNVSTSGYCFSVAANRGGLFSIGSMILLSKIEKVEFPQSFEGTVKHITPRKDSFGQTDLYVGVQFNKESQIIKDVLAYLGSR
jgi:hypothetical protein